jgi:excisionase family DNA binding protein
MVEKIAYTVREVAERTGLSRTFLFSEIKVGRLPSLKIGKNRLIHVNDETAYLAAHRQEPKAA